MAITTTEGPNQIKMLNARQVWTMFSWSRSTFFNRRKEGLMVLPVETGPKSRGYPSDEIEKIWRAYKVCKSKDDIKAVVAEIMEERKNAFDKYHEI
jgi:predicted DNA-binding transcriptional regulator AlpA